MDTGNPVRKSEILSQKIGDECIVYNPASGSMHVINSTAQFVLNLCDGTRSISEIEQHIRETHDLPDGAAVKRDLEAILHTFSDLGILQP